MIAIAEIAACIGLVGAAASIIARECAPIRNRWRYEATLRRALRTAAGN